MKIEIELFELDAIRQELKEATAKLRETEERLDAFDPKKEHQRVCDLATNMFRAYRDRIFTELGFDPGWGNDETFSQLEHWIGRSAWTRDRLQVTIGAHVSNRFRQAFLKLGVKTEDDTNT